MNPGTGAGALVVVEEDVDGGRGVARVDSPGSPPAPPSATAAAAVVFLPLLLPYVLLGGTSIPLGA